MRHSLSSSPSQSCRLWSLRMGSGATIRRQQQMMMIKSLIIFIVLDSLSPACSAGWSSYFSSDDNGGGGNTDVLVSPIVNREIQVSVKAPWPSSPEHSVLCEAFCFLRNYDFLDALATFQGRDQLVTYERSTHYALELAEQSGAVQDSSLLNVALTMRAMAPACELHRSIVQDRYALYTDYLEAFVVVAQGDGRETIIETSSDLPTSIVDLPVLTPQERRAWLLPNENIRQGARTVVVNDNDHVDNSRNDDPDSCSSSPLGLVILYARLGGHSFATFYRRLVELEIPFVVRHMGSDPAEDHEQPETVLQGYGVRLDIRNVEYKVFDDKKDDVDETTQAAMINLTGLSGNENITQISSHFLAGVNLSALALDDVGPSVYDLQKDLWTLHERSEAQSGLIPPNWQRRKLSLQAATVVVESSDPLLTLQDVSQNLPSVASTLVRIKVPEPIEEVAEPMERNLHRMIQSSGGGLWINGRIMNVERPSFNVFEMIKLLQEEYNEMARMERVLKPFLKEKSAMEALKDIQEAWIMGTIGTESSEGDDAGETIPSEDGDDADASEGQGQFRIDLATGDEGSVIYMNDLEKDKGYARLPTSMQQMLMAMQYGMPPSVRRNLFTLVVVEDPVGDSSLDQNLGDSLMGQLAQQQFPARLAVVVAGKDDIEACSRWIRSSEAKGQHDCPLEQSSWLTLDNPPNEDELKTIKATSRDFHRLYSFMRQEYADKSEVLVAYKLYLGPSLKQHPPANSEFYSLFDLFSLHNELLVGLQIASSKVHIVEIARSLQENEEDSNFSYAKSVRFAVEKGVQPGMSFVNGRPLPTDAEDADKIQIVFSEEQQMIFGMIVEQKLTDTKPRNLYYKLIKGKKKNVFPRLHPLLTASSSYEYIEIPHGFGIESLLSPQSMSESPENEADSSFLFEAFLELDTAEGLTYAKDFLVILNAAFESIEDTSVVARYRILPSTVKAARSPLCLVLSHAADYGFEKLLGMVESLILDPEANIDADTATAGDSSCTAFPILETGLPSRNFVTANGRIYQMNGEPLDPVDIELLTSINLDSTKFASNLLKPHVADGQAFDAISRTTAFLMSAKSAPKKRTDPSNLIRKVESHFGVDANLLTFSWNADTGNQASMKMKVTAIVDPVSETAQRLSTLLAVIRDELKLPLKLVLAPTMQLGGDSDVPISSYYRFVANPTSFQGGTGSPRALFTNLPTGRVLTVRMDVPEPWDVQQTLSIQDTDNLRCDLQSGCGDQDQKGHEMLNQDYITRVEYGLEHLLFFGQCYDTKLSPPNGLQLVLSKPGATESQNRSKAKTAEIEADGSVLVGEAKHGSDDVALDSHYSDTLVMKTVGYWQLRANPGVWNLKINDKSRGAEIFQMVDGKVQHGMLRVFGDIEGNEKRLVMGDFAGDGRGEMLLVKRKPGYEKASLFYDYEKDTVDDDVVHVFSLATGHLYERFLKIMMLSVTKRTSTKVKFWLFENFLSPTFKASSMAMAKRIGCEVEFVTYKWPEWLRGQSEKQRIIWGYKILFLDVLFPLGVKKIIYVDSDQVVRGDLKELRDMDLQGAPYGYTPMCSSNEATIGFQFWRQGFCKLSICFVSIALTYISVTQKHSTCYRGITSSWEAVSYLCSLRC